MSLSINRSIRHKLLLATSLCITAALLQSPAHGGIYKWTDAAGEIHYSQTPPPEGIKTEKIQGAAPPPGAPAKITEALQSDVQSIEESAAKEKEATEEASKQQELADANERNCITSRNNLNSLEQGGRMRYLTAEGEVIRLTEEERQQRIKDTNDQIKEFCTN